MSTGITSHEYARKLQALAEWLLTHDNFITGFNSPSVDFFPGNEKYFTKAVLACGNGQMKVDSNLIVFAANAPYGTKLEININKDTLDPVEVPKLNPVPDPELIQAAVADELARVADEEEFHG